MGGESKKIKGINMGDIAVYARVSVEHGNRKDDTVENQILSAGQFIKGQAEMMQKGIRLYKDIGYTGQNFERPDWKRLVEDAEKGEIDILVVKDFSRIGRNYIETGEIIENKLPLLGVRVISVSDGYDSSVCGTDLLSVGLKNIINDWYAKENGRKVSFVKCQKRENGEYMGGIAPYGYKTEIIDGKRLLVSDKSMEIVKIIRKKRRDGMTSEMLADWLAENRINKPSVYRKTGKLYSGACECYEKWDSSCVRRVWGSRAGYRCTGRF